MFCRPKTIERPTAMAEPTDRKTPFELITVAPCPVWTTLTFLTIGVVSSLPLQTTLILPVVRNVLLTFVPCTVLVAVTQVHLFRRGR